MTENPVSIEIPRKIIRSSLLASSILLIIALLLWIQISFDEDFVLLHNVIYDNSTTQSIFILFSRYGMGFISLVIGSYTFCVNRREELESSKPYIVFVIFTFAFASISGDILKEIIGRPRPAASLFQQIANSAPANSPSFPSGHTIKSMALALPFALVIPGKDHRTRLVKIITIIAATFVSYSRIALQRHYLSDVLMGIAITLVFIPFGIWIVNNFYRKLNIGEEKLDVLVRRLGFVFCLLAIPLCML